MQETVKKEYIERGAVRDMMEQALVDEWEIQYADDRLDEIPAADVVEVVRCRDCKYKEQNAGRYHVKLPFYCTLHDEKFCDEMEFCSYGAKMDGGADDDGVK